MWRWSYRYNIFIFCNNKSLEGSEEAKIENKSEDNQLHNNELSKTGEGNQKVVNSANNPIEEKSESSSVETENSENEPKS